MQTLVISESSLGGLEGTRQETGRQAQYGNDE